MRFTSLKGKLVAGVCALVLGSGALLSFLVTQRYTRSLHAALTAQAEGLAHAAALEATDRVLINDVVSLQKLLENQMSSNPSISYIFVLRDGKIPAHTFAAGVPAGLIDANAPIGPTQGNAEDLRGTGGESFIDIAWPIFEGNAGVLRLGISKKPFEKQLWDLWCEIGALTIGSLVLALAASLLYVGRITRPLRDLTDAAQKLDEGRLDLAVHAGGADEVAALSSSFNGMVSRIKDYTMRLEEKTRELERSHRQTRSFCEIVREIGSLPTFGEVTSALIRRIVGILKCREMALCVLNDRQDRLYVAWHKNVRIVRDERLLEAFCGALEGVGGEVSFIQRFAAPDLLPDRMTLAARHAIIPLENTLEMRGALVVACPGQCDCDVGELEWVSLILSETAGVVRRAMLQAEASEDVQARMGQPTGFRGLIGKDPKMQLIYRLIEDIAPSTATVLIQGESGTGKELVARAIHLESDRREKSFVVINCSAYPETLLESELFGHEKGAFTGAVRRRSGRFEQAHSGTVFLDEIGEISPQAQIKLLRVLQTQSFERVGGEETLRVNVRVIAATNRNLAAEVERGRFREDLFFRLNVIPISLPPLRERRNDVPALANHFLERWARDLGKDVRGFSSGAMRVVLDYGWPGNVRELENSIEHAVVLAKGPQIEASDFPEAISMLRSGPFEEEGMSVIEASERRELGRILEQCGWNKKEAAKRLGMGRTTLYAKMKKYGISKPVMH
ncbi:MAG: sigma 54-interacting transcriptional regulator [Thermodesulfobacteriota bacterium]